MLDMHNQNGAFVFFQKKYEDILEKFLKDKNSSELLLEEAEAIGKGTTFSIFLPIQLKVVRSSDGPITTAELLTRKKILVVDDDPTLLTAIESLLKKTHDITVCDARSALGLLANHNKIFDGIITGINMPDVNGIDLYRFVSKHHKELLKYIIFIAGSDDTAEINEFIKSVKNPCLEKPFTSVQLLQAVNEIFLT